jgi:hypothetical protein
MAVFEERSERRYFETSLIAKDGVLWFSYDKSRFELVRFPVIFAEL